VGIRDRLQRFDLTPQLPAGRLARAAYVLPSGSTVASIPTEIATAFGLNASSDSVSRSEAMSVPAMRRARSIICGTIATRPIVSVRKLPDGTVERLTRPLLDQPDPNTTRAWTIAWTVDDLLFRGLAWWKVTDRDGQGYPSAAVRVSLDRVMVDVSAGRVYVDGQPVDHRDLIRFDGLDEGILANAASLRTALLLEAAVRRNASGLPPQDFLRPAEGAPEMTDPEIDDLLDEWATAREASGTAFLNRAVEHGIVGFDPRAGQLAEARQHQAAEIARLTNLDAEALDAPGGGSMTYANVESKRRERLDTTLSPFLNAIEQRLSMGDVTPRGQVVRFDPWAWLRGDTAGLITAGASAVIARLMTPNEVRQDWLDRGPLDGGDDFPAAPAPVEQEG
jgi:hypothetical protein